MLKVYAESTLPVFLEKSMIFAELFGFISLITGLFLP